METAIGFFLPNQWGEVARGLPADEGPVLDQWPTLGGNAFVVVGYGCQSMRLGAISVKVTNSRPELEFAGLVGSQKTGSRIIGFPKQRAIQLGRMANRLMNVTAGSANATQAWNANQWDVKS